jgi:preprotein translocase subunit SecD
MYINDLEMHNVHINEKVRAMEIQIDKNRRQYEKQMDSINDNYQEHIKQMRVNEQGIASERKMLKIEREDVQRLKDLYIASNEQIENMNIKMLQQIQHMESVVMSKD